LDAFGMLFSFEKSGNESYGRNVWLEEDGSSENKNFQQEYIIH
jgi:hypothetical protein